MIHKLKNGEISLMVNDRGAEMMSLIFRGEEYLWQGDPLHWKDRAINLFPIVGRLWNGKYTYKGKEYPMECHGFALNKKFKAKRLCKDALSLTLTDDEDTFSIYPFHFELTITYALQDNRITCKYSVKNRGNEDMPFGIGGHPGFIFPIKGEANDWYLEFDKGCRPKMMLLKGPLITGEEKEYFLTDGKIHLEGETMLQMVKTIILKDAGEKVSLRSDKYIQTISVEYTGFKYIAFWKSSLNSPFLCIEPWQSLPSYHGREDDLESKRDMVKLGPGQTFEIAFSIEINPTTE